MLGQQQVGGVLPAWAVALSILLQLLNCCILQKVETQLSMVLLLWICAMEE